MTRLKLLILIATCFLVQIGVDQALKDNLLGKLEWTALLDPVAHLALALMVVIPLAMRWKTPRWPVLVALFLALAIDLDHFIAAGSFSIRDAISLPHRPIAHSFAVALGVASLCGIIFRSANAAALVALALINHISRDGSGGGSTPMFWPSDFEWKIPWSWHLGFWLLFSLTNAFRFKAT